MCVCVCVCVCVFVLVFTFYKLIVCRLQVCALLGHIDHVPTVRVVRDQRIIVWIAGRADIHRVRIQWGAVAHDRSSGRIHLFYSFP